MKFAWLVTCNIAYLPSLKAMLGAVQYYGYKDIDVHILHDESIAEFVDGLKGYSFNVYGFRIEEIDNPDHCLYHKFIYTKYLYSTMIQDNYDAIMHIDADCMILDNFEQYFKIAALSGLFLCAQFPHTSIHVQDYKLKPVDWVNCMMPLANFPVFYDPIKYGKVMLDVWNAQPNEKTCSDSMRNTEMYFFNKAVYENGIVDDVLVLPGGLWVTDNFVHHTNLFNAEIAGKKTLWNATKDRIQVIHNKWWKEGVSEGEIERSGNNELTIKNIQTMKEMFDFLYNVNAKTAEDANAIHG